LVVPKAHQHHQLTASLICAALRQMRADDN
jgi:hypothetical protein